MYIALVRYGGRGSQPVVVFLGSMDDQYGNHESYLFLKYIFMT